MTVQSKQFHKEDKSPVEYLEQEANQNFRDMDRAVNNITPDNGTTSFSVTVTIPSGQELAINNRLSVIPNEFQVVDARNAPHPIRGTSEWTTEKLFLANIGPTEGQYKIRFWYTGIVEEEE
jgi:hypothetical protein